MSSFLRVWGVALILTSSCWNLLGQEILYVDQQATGNMDGSTWEDAFTDIRPALEAALSGDAIWVAEGVYRPGDTLQSRYLLDKDIRLLGGFSGTETQETDRDPVMHETILSGDVFGNDLPGNLQTNRQDNLFTILEVAGVVTQEAVIDGFVFRGGHARGDNTFLTNAWGGALFCSGAPVIRNCRFEDNFATNRGGAIYIQSNQANGMLIEACHFSWNESNEDGGAIFLNLTSGEGIYIRDCIFDQNNSDRRGGAVAIYNGSSAIVGCQFNGNGARQAGGAVQVQASFNQLVNTIDSCTFFLNEATRGGAVNLTSSSVFGAVGNAFEVTRCQFDLNESNDFTNNPNDDVQGGAIFLESNVNASETSTLIADCTFTNNTTAGDGGVAHIQFDGQESRLTFARNLSNGNESGTDGPLTIFSRELGEAEVMIDSCQFSENHALEGSAGVVIRVAEHAILNLRMEHTDVMGGIASLTSGFQLQTAEQAKVDAAMVQCSWSGNIGMAIINVQDGNDQMDLICQNIRLEDNAVFGPASFVLSGTGSTEPDQARVRFENVLVHHHVGGDVIWQLDQIKVKVLNLTCAENETPGFGMGDLATLVLQNSILANAGEKELYAIHPNGSVISLGGNVLDDDSFAGWLSPADQDNADPDFASLSSFALSAGSPAVDAGTQPDTIYPYDLAGEARIQGLAIDAGAFESAFTSSLDTWGASGAALDIHPNPAVGRVWIHLPVHLGFADRLLISDRSGILLVDCPVAQDIHSTAIPLDVSFLYPGMYLVRVIDQAGRQACGQLIVHAP